ncbi:MAG TPA: HNH endonuclease [Opitutales bacterium]|jgi:hypothetical protein|nr:HNH endonuclease [Opitutales bacterium]
MIPEGLNHNHFLAAVREIQANGVPHHRHSYRYDLHLGGRPYPPKYVIYLAIKIAQGKTFTKFNAVEAVKYFQSREYEIREKSGHKRPVPPQIPDENAESRFAEGKKKYKMHRKLERDSSIGKKAKELRLAKDQCLRCDVCNFSFIEQYGKHGEGYIEAHHTVPVSKLRGKKKTKVADIALVCSNCHSVIHRSKPMLSIVSLKKIVEKKSSKSQANH